MADPGFVHLHVHSSYSLLEGALTIARLCELAKADRQPALALTDTDNMFGALQFSAKMAGSGIQPIVGCAVAVDFRRTEGQPHGAPLVATNAPFFATIDDYEAHDALICIAEGKLLADVDRRQLTPEHRFKSRAEMASLFADLPEALASAVEIARRCAFRPRTQAP